MNSAHLFGSPKTSIVVPTLGTSGWTFRTMGSAKRSAIDSAVTSNSGLLEEERKKLMEMTKTHRLTIHLQAGTGHDRNGMGS